MLLPDPSQLSSAHQAGHQLWLEHSLVAKLAHPKFSLGKAVTADGFVILQGNKQLPIPDCMNECYQMRHT
jgi:hypothetical protein